MESSVFPDGWGQEDPHEGAEAGQDNVQGAEEPGIDGEPADGDEDGYDGEEPEEEDA